MYRSNDSILVSIDLATTLSVTVEQQEDGSKIATIVARLIDGSKAGNDNPLFIVDESIARVVQRETPAPPPPAPEPVVKPAAGLSPDEHNAQRAGTPPEQATLQEAGMLPKVEGSEPANPFAGKGADAVSISRS